MNKKSLIETVKYLTGKLKPLGTLNEHDLTDTLGEWCIFDYSVDSLIYI